jgi:hypothetical protein
MNQAKIKLVLTPEYIQFTIYTIDALLQISKSKS